MFVRLNSGKALQLVLFEAQLLPELAVIVPVPAVALTLLLTGIAVGKPALEFTITLSRKLFDPPPVFGPSISTIV